jgi:hypothetical protein
MIIKYFYLFILVLFDLIPYCLKLLFTVFASPFFSAADPDPGSDAFLTPGSGAGVTDSGSLISDPGSNPFSGFSNNVLG